MGDFILGYLLNAAWEAPLICAGAFLLLRFVRLDARERCWMGIGFLMLAVVLPALDPRMAPSFAPPTLPEAVSYAVAPDLPAAAPASAITDIAPMVSAQPAPEHAPGRITLAPLIGLGLLWAFLAAVAIGVARLAIGLLAASRLARRSLPIELPPAVLAPMRRLATAHGRRAIRVRASDSLTVPAVVGGLAPLILVPADFERHGEEAMTAALLHECAHVVRGDYAINLACEALSLPLIWHPAVHLIKSQIQADREAACDRLASSQMPAKRYASCLVALADAMSPAPRLALGLQTLFGRGELERRIKALLQTPTGEMRGRLLRAALLGGPVLGVVVTSGLIFHVEPAMAQAAEKFVAEPATIAAAPPPAVPATPPAAAAPATPATDAEAPADKPKGRRVVERRVRRWTTDDGKTHMIVSEDDRDLTPAEQAKLDADLAKAKDEAARAQAFVHSPEFHETIIKAEREASGAAAAEARAEAEAARAEARADGRELRAHINEMISHQKILINVNRTEIAAQMQRVKAILHDPEVQKALERAKAAEPEIRRALDRLDRELEAANDKLPTPPRPPTPPKPPAAPPAPPPEPEAP
jgi:beta-lactamase regulating signal transducer with metallopeptidase domain